ncbi:hypothetical protein FF38_13928 [Lucilia cuprina]|uniref:PNT domain-containing protein n=1 Tax=Lucilia cuprina TaxID=7375 RepID=A0A0L0CHZ6_LUCCU|nr:hypothetical protein FF38_13928 [Lucilia cuprina]
MEVESSYSKYAGRVPPLDLSEVNSICSTDSDLDEMWSSKIEFITSPAQHVRRNCNINHPYYDLHRKQYHNIQRHPPKNTNFTSTDILNGMSSYDDLPLDPRDWTRTDVRKWLIYMAVSEGLEVTSELTHKFPMNGKALCLMSLDMYLSRVPVGGKMLYRDFRVRLAKAMSYQS